MRKFLAAGFAAATLAAGAFGTATATAQPEPLEMPSFDGMTLQSAKETFAGMTGRELGTRVINTTAHTPMNPATWEVCGQKPSPGAKLTPQTSAAVAVAPPGMCTA
ncbi:hypothetical protein [Mycolicibacterium vaccae]|uniref:PASTA domain-containing protein n=1 Tax=Mycolicibacterium vaccae ATCC 25954 TaxID=1194972 RepID=K0V4R7_MYCVA|nr:hypothetical protein [Mycolicibacterium vaccae]ANI38279.1 hypothetical protein MYVA_1054 [Mycolicibacterium vaccae 95051]EJZ06084.1 hypothetical protein MVAC_23210 [Mycolicibacterium vaccae ATCC 25954]MCV7064251.1 hypothetical protein [Mycolicibacterium vaccae]